VIGAEVRNTDEWLAAIAAGRAVGSTRSTVTLYRHPRVRYIALRDAPPVPVCLAWPAPGAHRHAAGFVASARLPPGPGGAEARAYPRRRRQAVGACQCRAIATRRKTKMNAAAPAAIQGPR
jgi:hypothetical protein